MGDSGSNGKMEFICRRCGLRREAAEGNPYPLVCWRCAVKEPEPDF